MASEIKAKCRACNKEVPSDQFKLHYKLKQMVCPDCYSGRTQQKLEQVKKLIEKEPPKPVGWDDDDEYLERMSHIKKEQDQAQFSKVVGTDQVKCKCFKCKYEFKYDPFRKKPRCCPYCAEDIPKLRTFNLL